MNRTRTRQLLLRSRQGLAVALMKCALADVSHHINKALLETERAIQLLEERLGH